MKPALTGLAEYYWIVILGTAIASVWAVLLYRVKTKSKQTNIAGKTTNSAHVVDPAESEYQSRMADERQSYHVKELPEEAVEALNRGPQAPSRPELDYLMNQK